MAEENKILVGEIMGDVRQDNAFAALRKYRWHIIGLIIVVVAAVTSLGLYKSGQSKKAIAQTEAVNIAMNSDLKNVDALKGLNSPSVLAKMLIAKSAQKQGNIDEALSVYNEIAGDGALSPELRDLAALNAFSINDSMEPGTLAADGAPFAPEAKLIHAQKLVDAGNVEQGLSIANELRQDPRAANVSNLAEMLILGNGGELTDEIDQADGEAVEGETQNAKTD